MANYSLVADYSFRPFTFDEMVKPMLMYKDEYNKRLEDYLELNKNTDVFSYLSQTLPEDSKARQLYEGYANAKNAAFEDFSRNGLNINNKRALVDLKRRYQGEIGRLEKADEALKKELSARDELRYKDPSMLYANDNLSIDDFLDGKRDSSTLYGISGNELYTQGVNASKTASSRHYNAEDAGAIMGYYRDYVEKMGYTPEELNRFGEQIMNDFTAQVSALPELQRAAQRIMVTSGADANLSGVNKTRAQQQVIRGLVDGAVYQEKHSPQRDLGKLSAAESSSIALRKEERDFERMANGWRQVDKKDANGNVIGKEWKHDPELDITAQRTKIINENKKQQTITQGLLSKPTVIKITKSGKGGEVDVSTYTENSGDYNTFTAEDLDTLNEAQKAALADALKTTVEQLPEILKYYDAQVKLNSPLFGEDSVEIYVNKTTNVKIPANGGSGGNNSGVWSTIGK